MITARYKTKCYYCSKSLLNPRVQNTMSFCKKCRRGAHTSCLKKSDGYKTGECPYCHFDIDVYRNSDSDSGSADEFNPLESD